MRERARPSGHAWPGLAGGNTTTLGFASTVGGAYGPVIDDVRVETCRPCDCSK
ncbi:MULTISPECIES: hypothetical protein [unclassified Streptomyces]|uniref:hypothetical protein n=1 Tax=unclassified Streptomyces TaxID=2593676 RepID=UPI003369CA7D